MKPGVGFIAFSLQPPSIELHVSSLSGSRIKKNQVVETTFTDLELLNRRGLDEAAMIIGKYVLGTLQIDHPELFKQYPNLKIVLEPLPSSEELKKMDEELKRLDLEDED